MVKLTIIMILPKVEREKGKTQEKQALNNTMLTTHWAVSEQWSAPPGNSSVFIYWTWLCMVWDIPVPRDQLSQAFCLPETQRSLDLGWAALSNN